MVKVLLAGLVNFFLKSGVKINMREPYPKQDNGKSITGTRLTGTEVIASSPLNLVTLHRLLWRAPIVEQGGIPPHQAD